MYSPECCNLTIFLNVLFLCLSFPACHFGKLYGLVMSLSAVISLLQYPCFALVRGALHGDPLYVSARLCEASVERDWHFDPDVWWMRNCRFRWTSLWPFWLWWRSSILSTSSFTAGNKPAAGRATPTTKPSSSFTFRVVKSFSLCPCSLFLHWK